MGKGNKAPKAPSYKAQMKQASKFADAALENMKVQNARADEQFAFFKDQAIQDRENINRANGMLVWADRLLEVGQQKKLNLSEETEQLKTAKATLSEARTSWHALNFSAITKKADESFEVGAKVKDQLMKKLYPQSSE